MGFLANRNENIAPFRVMALMERAQTLANQGVDVIHLEVGEPDFPTPAPIIEAAQTGLAQNALGYTPATGLPELKQAIANYYQEAFQVAVDPGQVVITTGASAAIQLLCGLLFNPGDGVLVTDPGYPCNLTSLRLVGAVPQAIPVSADNQFQPSLAQVQAHWQANTKGLWLASPSNPCGTLLDPQLWPDLLAQLQRRQGALIVDEIYQQLVYDQAPDTVLRYAGAQENLFVINSFSKFFAMTGWRLGWLIAPKSCVPAINRLAQHLFLAPPSLAQRAALAAFSPASLAICAQRRDQLAQRRNFLLQELPRLGLKIPAKPTGAFYIYCDLGDISSDSEEFCLQLLEQQGVAVTPGVDFGGNGCVEENGRHYIRLAYTTSLERLQQAVDRIAAFIDQY